MLTKPLHRYQLYVREARRLVGDFVWTEHVPPQQIRDRGIGLGAYSFDCHWCSLYVVNATSSGGKASVAAEGRVNNGRDGKPAGGVLQQPFEMPCVHLLCKHTAGVPAACGANVCDRGST
jgi:hypothetical protein